MAQMNGLLISGVEPGETEVDVAVITMKMLS